MGHEHRRRGCDLSVFEAFPEDGLQSKESLKSKGKSLDVNSRDVFDYDPDLYTKMVRYPLGSAGDFRHCFDEHGGTN